MYDITYVETGSVGKTVKCYASVLIKDFLSVMPTILMFVCL